MAMVVVVAVVVVVVVVVVEAVVGGSSYIEYLLQALSMHLQMVMPVVVPQPAAIPKLSNVSNPHVLVTTIIQPEKFFVKQKIPRIFQSVVVSQWW